MVLIIDNYDSFTYNIYQAISTIAERVKVVRNDRVGMEELMKMDITHLVISPGPGKPEGAGISLEAVRKLRGRIPILGVCLGHQTIGQAFGATVVPAGRLMHGKSSRVSHNGNGVFKDLPDPFEAVRYHSLALERDSLPPDLVVSAAAEDGEIMGIRHLKFNIEGVQFHPESFGTVGGKTIFGNFLGVDGGIRDAA